MKKIFFLHIILFLFSYRITKAQSWPWAKCTSGNGTEYGLSTATDTLGNVFTSNSFNSPTITIGTYSFTNTGGYSIYTAKYDSNGNVLWAANGNATGVGQSWARSICTDLVGNAIISGYFETTYLYFGTYTLSPSWGNRTIFLTKYDSNGNVLWAKTFNQNSDCYSNAITTDKLGNIYMTGEFSGTLVLGTCTITSAVSGGNIFIAKFDPNGNAIWAKFAQTNWIDGGSSISTDLTGGVYIAGSMKSSTLAFGTNTVSNNGQQDAILAKYDSNGNALWAISAGGTTIDYGSSVSTDKLGNSYFGGSFGSSTISFGTYTLTNPYVGFGDQAFLVKIDPLGNIIWAKNYGGMWGVAIDCLNSDANGNTFVTGHCDYTIPIGSYTVNCPPCSAWPIYVASFDPNGNLLCADGLGSVGYGAALGVATDKFGNAYIAGSIAYDCTPFVLGTNTLIPTGMANTFVGKFNCSPVSTKINSYVLTDNASIYPNPNNGTFNFDIDRELENGELIIFNNIGQKVYSQKINRGKNKIELSNLSNGFYNYSFLENNIQETNGKLILEK